MLLDLGCVLHMLEDMGVPAHTRNDFLFEHYRTKSDHGSPFVSYVENAVVHNGDLSKWLAPNWTAAPRVFSKVTDYFDTDTRTKTSYPGATIPDTWGLVECTNYQFVSWTTIFRTNPKSLYYFTHPAFANTSPLVAGRLHYRSGYGVQHLPRGTMSTDYLIYPNNLDPRFVVLGACLDDCANITIPRTVNFAAGLVNYFFRGRLELDVHGGETQGEADIKITNKSTNGTVKQALKGGNFELYAYCYDGKAVAAQVTLPDWSNGVLPYNDSLTGTFTIPPCESPISSYCVVYKGQIVPNTSQSHTDPDDGNAIAVGMTGEERVVLYFTNCSKAYLDSPSQFESDLTEFRANCAGYTAGFYFTPRQWFPGEEPYEVGEDLWPDDDPDCSFCCDYSLADVIAEGHPEEIHFEELTSPPTAENIVTLGRNLLGGAMPRVFIVCHQDRPAMYYSWEDWDDWMDNTQERLDPGYCFPGPGGILFEPMTDWWDLDQEYYHTVGYRTSSDRWLYGMTYAIQYANYRYPQ